ncbi:MAG TPA: Gfo/Idh/MocA family oxidoreductase [Candidatus Bathyarchaeia archaeon]|nr:Gfo/Idh/MocA family oxidoreductase [Candidatus Bathyarchaeia archaeon]
MRFIVVGAGSIGQRHARNLRALGHEPIVFDTDAERLAKVGALLDVETLPTLAAGADRKADGILVCTPPASHVAVARETLDWGGHLFIEKPLAPSGREVGRLLEEAEARGRRVLVGCNLRFFKPLQRVKALVDEGRVGRVLSVRAQCGFYLPFWQPGTDYRQTYRAHAAQGGGILLDAIHDFDYLRWIFGEVREVLGTVERLADFQTDVEDFGEVTLRFTSGVIAQLHLDYLQRSYRRSCEVIGERGVIVWDYIDRRVTLFTEERDRWQGFGEPIDFNHNEMFVEEMAHFVRCLEGREAPVVDGSDALRTLRVVEAAKTSSAQRSWVTL